MKFLGHVAVVDVERCDTCLERGEHCFEVFVPVVEVDRQMILAALPWLEVGAFPEAAQAASRQFGCEMIGASGNIGPGQPAVAKDDG